MKYVDYVYNIVRLDCADMDAIYKDYIIQIVGMYGFNALYKESLIESCGVMNSRYLFVLCPKEPIDDIPEVERLKQENKKLRDLLMKGF